MVTAFLLTVAIIHTIAVGIYLSEERPGLAIFTALFAVWAFASLYVYSQTCP